MTTLDTALLRAVSAHPGLTFAGLLDAARAAGLDVGATEIDAAARALGLEHGDPGAYRYRLPGSVVGVGGVEKVSAQAAGRISTAGGSVVGSRSPHSLSRQTQHESSNVVHPDTIASSPAQSTLPRAGA